jgi:ABC-type phosphate transport system permease subunit
VSTRDLAVVILAGALALALLVLVGVIAWAAVSGARLPSPVDQAASALGGGVVAIVGMHIGQRSGRREP